METDNKVTYGAKEADADNETCVNIDAKYNSVLNYITEDNVCYANIIVIGATDYDSNICAFSNVGSRVDLYAPGEKLCVCSVSGSINGKFRTSYSAQHVTGAAGFALNVYPELPCSKLKDLIIDSAKEQGDYKTLCLSSLIEKVLFEKNKETASVNCYIKRWIAVNDYSGQKQEIPVTDIMYDVRRIEYAQSYERPNHTQTGINACVGCTYESGRVYNERYIRKII